MTDELQHRVDDPARVRALAHPIRLDLLDVLGDAEALTATECAALIGQSVASTSFHLHQLAKYGYVEPAERRGREKPWRIVSRSMSQLPDPGVEGSVPAVAGVADLVVQRETARIRAFLAQASTEPTEWVQAATVSGSTFWATADELTALRDDMLALVERFDGRALDSTKRPVGARRAHLFAVANPDPVADHHSDSDSDSHFATDPEGPRP